MLDKKKLVKYRSDQKNMCDVCKANKKCNMLDLRICKILSSLKC